MRGALLTYVQLRCSCGLIPARAGSTQNFLCRSLPCRAHPRPCGEHPSAANSSTTKRGSSPPVRGAPRATAVPPCPGGLIPARAGSTARSLRCHSTGWAHPRPCGEHVSALPEPRTQPGSSPPVRGALWVEDVMAAIAGLIPARAGSTCCCVGARDGSGAHPRPCGEHASCGKLRARWGGLIPARAGSTSDAPKTHHEIGAHPRPCGEHNLHKSTIHYPSGSSPPVRGAHLLTWGFTPYTGKIGLLWSQSLRPEYMINNCS